MIKRSTVEFGILILALLLIAVGVRMIVYPEAMLIWHYWATNTGTGAQGELITRDMACWSGALITVMGFGFACIIIRGWWKRRGAKK